MPMGNEKRLKCLQRLVRLLGWKSPLRIYKHIISEEECPSLAGRVITWYETGVSRCGRLDCFLQINEPPEGQSAPYMAGVYAIRYRICTGWHKFGLSARDSDQKREARRLWPWLAYEWFASIQKRRAFRNAHPECTGYTWHRLASGELPEPSRNTET